MATGELLSSTLPRGWRSFRLVVLVIGLMLAGTVFITAIAMYGGQLDTLANSDRFWAIIGAIGTLASVLVALGALYLQRQQVKSEARRRIAEGDALLPVALDPGDSDAQHAAPGSLAAAPDSAPSLVQRAAPTGPLDERIRLLEQARKADPAYTPATYALANLLYSTGRYDDALAAINDALERERTKPSYFALRARVLRALAKHKEALGAAWDAVQVSGIAVPAYAWQTLGLLYAETGDAENAEQALRKALAGAPANIDVKRELADVLVRRGKHDEAVSYYRQVIAARPNDLATHMKLAAVLRRLHRYGEALNECTRILEGNPFYAPAEEEQSAIFAAQGKRREARAARQRAKRMLQARPRAASVRLR